MPRWVRFSENRKSLFYRLALAYFYVIVATALIYSFAFILLWRTYRGSSEQWSNWELAESLAHELRPLTSPSFNKEAVERALFRFERYNPNSTALLLNKNGKVLLSVSAVLVNTVDTKKIEEFLTFKKAPTIPIFGDDPFSKNDELVIFSAARIQLENENGYLYIPLRNFRTEKVFALQGDTFAFYGAIGLAAISFILIFPLGLCIFYLLTRRVRTMTETLREFDDGDYTKRLPTNWKDEFGVHSRVFNTLADSLTSHIDKLTEMDATRREMFLGISHDLRTPVAVMRANLELLLDKTTILKPEQTESLLVSAFASSTTLSLLLEDLFELGKLDQPEYQLDETWFPPLEVVADVIEELTPMAKEQGILLEFEFEEDLPSAYGSPHLLHRAIFNLVENAIRYTPTKGTISVGFVQHNGQLEFQVKDTGIGMTAEEIRRVTERFYRADKARALAPKGSGLGLSIVKKIIELHGHKLSIQSEPGEGTTCGFAISTQQRE